MQLLLLGLEQQHLLMQLHLLLSQQRLLMLLQKFLLPLQLLGPWQLQLLLLTSPDLPPLLAHVVLVLHSAKAESSNVIWPWDELACLERRPLQPWRLWRLQLGCLGSNHRGRYHPRLYHPRLHCS